MQSYTHANIHAYMETFAYTKHIYSDGTLNPSGVRFGTAELYDIGEHWVAIRITDFTPFLHVFTVDKFSEVSDSVCVGQPVDGDERVVLFIKMVKGKRYVYLCNFFQLQLIKTAAKWTCVYV